jgi:hypothetical protein
VAWAAGHAAGPVAGRVPQREKNQRKRQLCMYSRTGFGLYYVKDKEAGWNIACLSIRKHLPTYSGFAEGDFSPFVIKSELPDQYSFLWASLPGFSCGLHRLRVLKLLFWRIDG